MNTLFINDRIESILDSASTPSALNTLIEDRLAQIDAHFDIADSATITAIITHYLRHTTHYLEEASIQLKGHLLYERCQPLFDSIEAFFQQEKELYDLLYSCYFALRVVEELNDKMLFENGHQLCKVELLRPNLLLHTLIGDPFACKLSDIASELVTTSASLSLGSAVVGQSKATNCFYDLQLRLFAANESPPNKANEIAC
ncbi:hypothetical protein EDC56_3222 [Sinobacterium caligoides]|uniref:Uncharacterized protein n=1 Tax=Sinobacterium caligoides TaxID=933926 RepID=A0A3N2DGT8_9GAMM|nr:hypothetical protein [Sinobacterium caligoides]ROR98982.1 hypothetical protein EDC56_3222 [Sinobacterium caligoides]